ncbi:hypothetical protein RhiirA4_476953 [Rhizophagus irregularis]|uniref:Uncharacterized protein n=1 Tax=Rhizophagus irregularis TaxID=588596 RepID=A0A2I1HCE6_9GLOM|nr:hypothetical protein RhiirA4_476953 [Rhizophagus irregularis]
MRDVTIRPAWLVRPMSNRRSLLIEWRFDELKDLLRNVLDIHLSNKDFTEYKEVKEVSRGIMLATTENDDEDHNKEEEEKLSKSTVGDNGNNSVSNLHMDDT